MTLEYPKNRERKRWVTPTILYSILQKEELILGVIDDRGNSKDAISRVKKKLKLKKDKRKKLKENSTIEGIENRKDVTFYPFEKKSTGRRSQQL